MQPNTLRYRLALDLGSTSIGWAMLRLKTENDAEVPYAIIKAGVRIFNNGRDPKTEASLAVTRRDARAMRRRRDRLLKRKVRMMQALVDCGFFPKDDAERKALETLNPYQLRADGLDRALSPAEFARALFHINQRRGFKSNRKTDTKENDASVMKNAIKALYAKLEAKEARTVGEWLYKRMNQGQTVRARHREETIVVDGRNKKEKSYDLYIDRAAVEAEFDALWDKQAALNPSVYRPEIGAKLKDILLFQRNLRPVKPGRCTLEPDEERAPLALPSQQRFRMLQEVNNLRIIRDGLHDEALTIAQRDQIIALLEVKSKVTFTALKKALKIGSDAQFNLEDPKREELKGNATSAILSKKEYFGEWWLRQTESLQDEVVSLLINEQSEATVIEWLQAQTGVSEETAAAIANAKLPDGYGSLSRKALDKILPELRKEVITYDKAVIAAGYDHHSAISHAQTTGEIMPELPYYGEPLQRHVGFGTGNPQDTPEKRFGKIANPTVHIGLNQIRVVVNALIKKYGHPSEVIVEVARDLKQSREQRMEENKRQADNQKRNERIRQDISSAYQSQGVSMSPENVKHDDVVKYKLWEELNLKDSSNRCCPYSGVQISAAMLLNGQAEVEHILPSSRTLDDSMNNKTVALREANRIKGNQTPWEAFGKQSIASYDYAAIQERAKLMDLKKRYRFAQDGYEKWLKDDKGFLARALNDTRYLSRIAKEYLSLICPQNTRVIPGQMTAMLRGKFGLNRILDEQAGIKNRDDHRHHAVDACVIGVTDQGLLQRFAQASSDARQRQLNKLVSNMPLPWDTYREHVARAVAHIYVSHKPDHGYEGAMMEETSYGIAKDGRIKQKRKADGSDGRTISNLIAIGEAKQPVRHGVDAEGKPLPYKGYVGGSNYCIEITRSDSGKWEGEVISTFKAYEIVLQGGLAQLRHPKLGQNGKPLVMRLNINDSVALNVESRRAIMRIRSISPIGQVFMAEIHEANADARSRDKNDPFNYLSKVAGSYKTAKARQVTISPIGELGDRGFKG